MESRTRARQHVFPSSREGSSEVGVAHSTVMRRLSELLQRRVTGELTQAAEKELIEKHCAHFIRRVRRLGPSYFPAEDKSEDALRSLALEAYVVFTKEAFCGAHPPFRLAVENWLGREAGWLYYWRGSATIQFMGLQAGSRLHELKKLRRNVRIHLNSGHFVHIAKLGGETLWGLRGHTPPGVTFPRPQPDDLATSLGSIRGRDAVRAILLAADTALTLTEIVAVWARVRDLVSDDSDHLETAPMGDLPEEVVERQDLGRRVQRFWKEVLNAEDRRLIIARGHSVEKRLHPWVEVAPRLGDKSRETYRKREERILILIREYFAGEPPDAVAQALSAQIQAELSAPVGLVRYGY